VNKKNISNIIDFIAQNSKEIDDLTKWGILVSNDLEERLELLISLPNKKQIDKKLDEETKARIRNQQDEYYLREKMKVIKKRLGELGDTKNRSDSSEVEKILQRLAQEPYPEHVKKVVREEIERYETMPSYSSEANVVKQYVDYL